MKGIALLLVPQFLVVSISGSAFHAKLQVPALFGRRSILTTTSTSIDSSTLHSLATLRGGGDEIEIASNAFEWCANLGAPAALVGGAVLATLAETREDMAPRKSDTPLTRLKKKIARFLLLSAFALEIVSIFVTTVTGTMLLAQGDRPTGTQAGVEYHSPMGFLRHNHEFEYLTARITFLQGLFHWLLATAMEVLLPKKGEGETAERMNRFIGYSLVTIILLMLSFYNAHMTFYHNYFHMISVYCKVLWHRFFWRWPPRFMSFFYIPALVLTIREGWYAFTSPHDLDGD